MINPEHIGIVSPVEFWSTVVPSRIARIQGVLPLDATTRVSDARQMLDDELAAMHLATCAVRTRRNALAPISSLPPEVLAQIFQLYAIMAPPFSGYLASSSSSGLLGWIRVTFVCRYWRDTALHNPALWSDIRPFVNQNWLELALARAKAAPLSIHKQLHAPDDGLINKHLSHTRHLSVSGAQQVIDSTMKSWTSPANILESLDLEMTSLYSSGNLELPEHTFSGHTPFLRRLQVKNIRVPWTAPILNGLTHLHVDLGSAGPRNPPHAMASFTTLTYEQLFGALERMPTLQELILRSCIPLRSPAQALTETKVTELPSLQVLSLAGTWPECDGMTKRLEIPPSCRLKLAYHLMPIQPFSFSSSTAFFTSHAKAASDQPPLLTLSLSMRYGEFGLSAWRVCNATDSNPAFYPSETPDLCLTFPNTRLSLADNAQALCDALQLDNIRALSIDSGSFVQWTPQKWIDTFGRCEKLQHVKVTDTNAIHFCQALNMSKVRVVGKNKKKGKQRVKPENLFARDLKTITLEQVDFDYTIGNSDTAFHDLLVKWLTNRKKVVEPPMLIIEDSSIRDDWVEELEEVTAVEWDQGEGEYAEEDEFDEYYSDEEYPYGYDDSDVY